MATVIGLGGVFLRCADPEATKAWYRDVLGLPVNDHGGFDFAHADSAERFGPGARTIFAPFAADTDYFAPSDLPFMINLMVDDLDGMIERLRDHGVALIGTPESHDYGRFAWVMDPDGRKIELWQPVLPPTPT